MTEITAREMVLMERAAEDAIYAFNVRYEPFVEAVAKPLKIIALIEKARANQTEPNCEQLKELLQKLIDDEYTTMRPSMAYEIQKALRGSD